MTVTARLLDIVCKRTGYPAEMLGLDLDLEADLGIDSIKRVEILGMLAESNGGQTLNVAMEKLTNIKTLRGILDCLATCKSGQRKSPSRDRQGAGTEALPYGRGSNRQSRDRQGNVPSSRSRLDACGGIRRMTVAAVDAPPLAGNTPILPGGTLILTDDGGGIAAALASASAQSWPASCPGKRPPRRECTFKPI